LQVPVSFRVIIFRAFPLWLRYLPEAFASGKEEEGAMIARPRCFGILEFGLNSIIYHEGRMYRVRKVKLNSAQEQVSATAKLPTRTAKICPECGHGHHDSSLERCVLCGAPLGPKTAVDNLYRIETVETTQTECISIDDG
jgi:hypothetical protein